MSGTAAMYGTAATYPAAIHSAASSRRPADDGSASWSHGLQRRIAAPESEDVLAALEQLHADPLAAALSVWIERVGMHSGSAAAHRYRQREGRRPLGMNGPALRLVARHYADGVAELVVVGDRRTSDAATLEALVAALPAVDPVLEALNRLARPGRTPAGRPQPQWVGTPVSWGVPDPGATGTARAPVFVRGLGDRDVESLLTRAVELVLAEYDATTSTVFLERGPGTEAPEEATVGIIAAQVINPTIQYTPCMAAAYPVTVAAVCGPDAMTTVAVSGDLACVHSAVLAAFATMLERAVDELSNGEVSDGAVPTPWGDAASGLMRSQDADAVLQLGAPRALSTASDDLARRLRAVAAAHPTRTAVDDGKTSLSYAELDERSDRFAAGLRSRGARPGDFIGVGLSRSVDLVVTIVAVVKTGASYVPMEPSYPSDRLEFICADAGLALVVADEDDDTFVHLDGCTVLTPATLAESPVDAPDSVDGSRAGYVIYTSGTTGRPKGVVVPGSNVLALVDATAADFELGPNDVWTMSHSAAFDFSVWELWGCLLTGGQLVVVSHWVMRSPAEFLALVRGRGVTVLNQTPSAFGAFQRAEADASAPGLPLRLLIFGGEALEVRSLRPWLARHPAHECRVVNMYGITETTVHVTAHDLVEAETSSRCVGPALPGWRVSVRNESGLVRPVGAAGEIWIAGCGLADRYLHRPDLTAERFVSDPRTGDRWYRSGDLGRLRPDGSLDHLGRIDSQVKLRGFRIELEEIRAVLLTHPGVAAAAVMLVDQPEVAEGQEHLIAYVVGAGSPPRAPLDAIRALAVSRLPEYMVPARFIELAELPLTANGKLDRTALVERIERPAPAPEGSDDVLLGVWSEVLGRPVSPDDDFFEVGGNSLLAVRLSTELKNAGIASSMNLRDLYLHPTPRELDAFLNDRDGRD